MDAGLEKVVAAETVLSDVHGADGRLIIRGKDVEDLARAFDFEADGASSVVGLLRGHAGVAERRRRWAAARVAAFERLKPDFARLTGLPEVEALRAALALAPDGHDLGCGDRSCGDDGGGERRDRAPESRRCPAGAGCRRGARRGPAADDPGRDAFARSGAGAGCVSRDGLGSRAQCVDLRGAMRRLDARGTGLGGDRGAVGAEGAAAWRRARAGAGHAGCDRHCGARRGVDPRRR